MEFSYFSGMMIFFFLLLLNEGNGRRVHQIGDASLVFQRFSLITKEEVVCRDIPVTVGLSLGVGGSGF